MIRGKSNQKLKKRISAIIMSLLLIFSVIPQTQVVYGAENGTANAEVYFVNYATKKLITLDGVLDNGIDSSASYDANKVPDNAKFTIYYGTFNINNVDYEVVNFTCKGANTSWKADGDKVTQIAGRTNPGGWESVRIIPQGDGTIAFRSNAGGEKYITVKDNKLALSDDDTISANEKFVMYTETAPKKVNNVSLNEITGDSMKVEWSGVTETLYSGYEVLYSKNENADFILAGITSENLFTIEGLELNTKYYVKVRTITNTENGAYSESNTTSATTLKNYKPKAPVNLSVKENENNSLSVAWSASKSATGYKVYRAESRFSEYKLIGSVNNGTEYIDINPNKSRYENYYKIQAYNEVDNSSLSEPISIEIQMFGKNTYIFSDKDDQNEIYNTTESIYNKQHYNQFGTDRYALAYKPGDYTSESQGVVDIGYYTQILGLGKTPYDVNLENVKTPCALSGNNATCNFWVGIENVTIKERQNSDDPTFSFQWAVSQAAPARRLNVERTAVFDWYYGWASGGYVADSYFAKAAGSYSQQQYYYRNCYINDGAYGVNWNEVIQGCVGNTVDTSGMKSLANGNGVSDWGDRNATTVIESTPKLREKPFLYFDTEKDEYRVFVPAMKNNYKGISWSYNNMGEGTSISVDKYFYIANPDVDTADSINKQLKAGKNIIFQPGVYHVDKPIEVKKANTVLLGLGLATIIPDNKDSGMKIGNVGGVSVAGLIFDAGNYSETMLTVGTEGTKKNHEENPVVLQDVFFRVGGTGHLGRTDSCLVINSDDTIVDHTWIWRADHGDNTGWYQNTAKNGMVVNGDRVTAYGLFCEHFQEYDILWRGESGSTYFLQNEKCYDPQNQDEWMSHDGTKKGYAAYKVANNVENHYAVGLGIYDVFIYTNGASIYLDNAIEVPNKENVLIENACIVEIADGNGPKVGINHIVNNTTAGIRTGAGNNGGYAIQRLLKYCNEESVSLDDDYTKGENVVIKNEVGEKPSNDVTAEKDIVKEPETKDDEKPLWENTDKDFQDKLDKAKLEEEQENQGNNEKPGNGENQNPSENGNSGNGENQNPSQNGNLGNENNQNQSQNGNNNKDNGSKPQDNKNIANDIQTALEVGTKINVGKYIYKVTAVNGNKGNVTLIGVNKKYVKKLKKITVAKTVKYNGYTLKINKIGKKAFAKCIKVKTITVKGNNLRVVSKNIFNKKVKSKITVKANKKIKKLINKALK